MAIQRPIGSVSIALLPMASRAVTPLLAFCAALSSIPCLKHCCAGSMNNALIRKTRIAFDGKVLRSSFREMPKDALQLVTAYDTENGLVLSQKATPEQEGEIRNRQRDAGHS